MNFNEQSESVMLEMKQEGVPLNEKDPTTSNWHNYYFNPIKGTFG
jgi:activator of HSP90 ATPase